MDSTLFSKKLLPKAILIPLLFCIALTATIFALTLLINDGLFTYTLDDPYIHLSLAKQLVMHAHYGLNPSEYASPSSSIIWPLLLAIAFPFIWPNILPLILNLIFLFISIISLAQFNQGLLNSLNARYYPILLTCVEAVIFNLIFLVFTGMEHSLQVLCSIMILIGLIEVTHGKSPSKRLLFFIILGPLVRYELLCFSLLATAFLYHKNHVKLAITTFVAIGATLTAFGVFLYSLGLKAIPESIWVKSHVTNSSGLWIQFLSVSLKNLSTYNGVILALMSGLLLMAWRRHPRYKAIALIVALSILAQLFFGLIQFSGRYESYTLVLGAMAMSLVYQHHLLAFFRQRSKTQSTLIVLLLAVFIGPKQIMAIPCSAYIANTVYLQQYQMARFVKAYWRRPVAVNDIGLVRFENQQYVLDLWGLANQDAFHARLSGRRNWLEPLVAYKNIELIMIYPGWFQYQIPNSWISLGHLTISSQLQAPIKDDRVNFYTPNNKALQELCTKLSQFSRDLPKQSTFYLSANCLSLTQVKPRPPSTAKT